MECGKMPPKKRSDSLLKLIFRAEICVINTKDYVFENNFLLQHTSNILMEAVPTVFIKQCQRDW